MHILCTRIVPIFIQLWAYLIRGDQTFFRWRTTVLGRIKFLSRVRHIMTKKNPWTKGRPYKSFSCSKIYPFENPVCNNTNQNLWVVTYESLKTKENTSWQLPKVVVVAYKSSHLQELLITEFKWQFKWGFTMVVVTTTCSLLTRG